MPFHRLVAVPVLLWLGVVLAARSPLFGAASPPPSTKCERKCGSVDIPYPFGIVHSPDDDDGHCAMNGFGLTCNETGINGGGHRPFSGIAEVLGISLQQGQAQMRNKISYYCYNTTTREMDHDEWWLDFEGTPYRFSDTANKFTVIGCQTLSYINGDDGDYDDDGDMYTSGCVAMCRGDDVRSTLSNGSCSGIGCCQTAIPKGLQYYHVEFDSGFNTSEIHNVSRCSYAVLMDSSNFTFSTTYATSSAFIDNYGGQAPFVMDWAIGNETCDAARNKPGSYACVSDNSECFNSLNGPGYICNCSKGFHGNPYLQDPEHGCKDIDECKLPQVYRCLSGICKNKLGGYDCPCKFGMKGNGKAGTCADVFPLVAKVIVGLAGLVVLIVLMVLAHQLLKLRKFYKQNGGPTLEGVDNIRIYKRKQLQQMTNNYETVIGEGQFGKVYKGTLKDTQEVAIKKTIKVDEVSNKYFTDEVIIQSRMRHKNIVRLLGCCLEMDVPMLMYDYVVKGSLYDVLFKSKDNVPVDTRLRIAIGSAEGLAYMHSAVESTIRHGDVKSANILLDASFTPKISDFGTSKLLARGKSEKTEWVTGDKAYIDPAYMVHGIVTQKSDVYSFGIVLIELITRRVAKYDDNMSYAKNFVQACQDQRVRNFVDNDITSDNDIEILEMVSGVAMDCLKLNPEERLDMRQVENCLRNIGQSE